MSAGAECHWDEIADERGWGYQFLEVQQCCCVLHGAKLNERNVLQVEATRRQTLVETATPHPMPKEALTLQQNISRIDGFSMQLLQRRLEVADLQKKFQDVCSHFRASEEGTSSAAVTVTATPVDSEDSDSEVEDAEVAGSACNAHPDPFEMMEEDDEAPIESLVEAWVAGIEHDL
jgi:hypothetical protein